ncbi:MAG: hypothetical protein M5R38_09660 [Candidatus Methylomirabilis sp.]|nr:hypothetical protein [Candidatus Methylomirabilis sp.]
MDLLQRFERLQNQMAQLREFDVRLRTAAGLEVKSVENAVFSMGGADTVSSRALMTAALVQQTSPVGSTTKVRADDLGGEIDRLSREMHDRNKSFRGLLGRSRRNGVCWPLPRRSGRSRGG